MKLYELFLTHKRRILVGLFSSLIAGFSVLSYFVMITPPSLVDLYVSREIQERHNTVLDSFMIFLSSFGVVWVSGSMVAITAAVFYLLRFKREAAFTVLTLVAGAISSGIKVWVGRPRPTEDLVTIVEKAQHQSFPSGHTLFYTVFFGFMIVVMGNYKSFPHALRVAVVAICGLMIFMGPVSRVYLGAHWFTDVLGGFVLGLIYLFVLSYFYLFRKRAKVGAGGKHPID